MNVRKNVKKIDPEFVSVTVIVERKDGSLLSETKMVRRDRFCSEASEVLIDLADLLGTSSG